MTPEERVTLIGSIVHLIPDLPDGADGYFLTIGGGRGKYIRDPQGVAEEIVDIACCQEVCEITGYGVWKDDPPVAWSPWEAPA